MAILCGAAKNSLRGTAVKPGFISYILEGFPDVAILIALVLVGVVFTKLFVILSTRFISGKSPNPVVKIPRSFKSWIRPHSIQTTRF